MYVFQASEIKRIDTEAAEAGLSPFTLMENAGRGLYERIKPLLSKHMKIAILSGRGNNGGDGIVLARYLLNDGFSVSLFFPLGKPKTQEAKAHEAYFAKLGFTSTPWEARETYDVVVDSLLGVGVKLPLSEEIKAIVHWANSQPALRIAIDMPTGVEADRGVIEEEAEDAIFRADYTFSLHGVKPSAFLFPSSKYYGKVDVVSIGLRPQSDTKVITEEDVRKTLARRPDFGHKGTFGLSLIVAGSEEMPGSAALATIGAIRSGTGRLVVATTKSAIPIIANQVPEATFMANGLERIASGEIPEQLRAAGIGPGLVDTEKTRKALDHLLTHEIPVVVDAGALEKREKWVSKGPVVVTPHPGEFSRMTGLAITEIQERRLEVAKDYAQKMNVIVVLKGQFTVIAFPNGKTYINPSGNSGLAKGGSGDVLTGMLVSFLATHERVEDAVINAVYIHGRCADLWRETSSERSMTASDFKYLLPQVLKHLEQGK